MPFILIVAITALFQLFAPSCSCANFRNVAFYYAANPPLEELASFDLVVIDPDAAPYDPLAFRKGGGELCAYLSVGEADPARSFFPRLKGEWLIGENKAWRSRVVDLSSQDYRNFFLDQILEPLWQQGYRIFFLDTLDSWQLIRDQKREEKLLAGQLELIRSIKRRHPEARLIFNRGFEMVEQLKGDIYALAAESLYQNFDPSTGRYGEVQEGDRRWLLERLEKVRKLGIPVIVIDYVEPARRELARSTATRIMGLGFIPWVTDRDLAMLGVGSIELLPRKILGLYHGGEAPDPAYSNLLRFAVTPLNYLGFQVDLHDMRLPPPEGLLKGRYAGLVVWPNVTGFAEDKRVLEWFGKLRDQRVPMLFLDRFGIDYHRFAKVMGGRLNGTLNSRKGLQILKQDKIIGFEKEPTLPRDRLPAISFQGGRPLLQIADSYGKTSDPVAVTPWGGYALEPFVLNELVDEVEKWVLDPFSFFSQGLQLEQFPVPDLTTENGERLLLVHIDADGYESMVERPGGGLAVTELRERILEKYRIPTTFSVITSILGDRGFLKERIDLYREEARAIFRLPWVEAGSHTFSHPFYWQDTKFAGRNYDTRTLELPGYSFDLEAEVAGSINFINQNLLPPGKQVRLLQWSGDCTPGVKGLAAAYKMNVGNINGGYTMMLETDRSITKLAPTGVKKGEWFQVFAPNQNENVYTNDWGDPFYGYRRVIETFRLTDSPRRLKPVNIYYHTYSVTKEASRHALEEVYDWALTKGHYPIYTSEYVDKVLDFNRTTVAAFGNGWLIRNHGDLRQLRMPISAGYPDLKASRGVTGFSDHNDQRYIHLSAGREWQLVMSQKRPDTPWLAGLTGQMLRFTPDKNRILMQVRSHTDGRISFENAAGCRLLSDGEPLAAKMEGGRMTARIRGGELQLELVCER